MPKNIIALDLGATKTAIGVVSERGQVINLKTIPTPSHQGRAYFIKKLVELIKPLFDKNTKAIALGVAGQVNLKKQTVNLYPNFPAGFQNFNLAKALEDKFKLPVFIDNDVHCFVLGESIYGLGQKYQNIVGLTLGTGIGGGLMINKKLYRGHNNLVGEFGQMTIDASSPICCACGQMGHWEALASGTGLINLYLRLTKNKKDAYAIEAEAKAGKKEAVQAVRLTAHYLAIGLANLINILGPEIIIIGGGFANFKMIWPEMIKAVPGYLLQPKMQKTKIVKSQLGDKAILLGAALLAKPGFKN
ncbi:MAG: ROK family protein [bacterium]